VRHSFNIVVAMLSMAAGAWQGTTAQTEQPGSTASEHQIGKAPRPLTLRGCVQKGQAAGSFVLISAEPAGDAALEPVAPSAAASPAESADATAPAAGKATARKATYEIISGKADVDLTEAVGRHVEAQGIPERTAPGATADDSPSAAAAAADSPSADSPAGTSGQKPGRSRVRVTALRTIGGPCE
jgi:hypothetical protein